MDFETHFGAFSGILPGADPRRNFNEFYNALTKPVQNDFIDPPAVVDDLIDLGVVSFNMNQANLTDPQDLLHLELGSTEMYPDQNVQSTFSHQPDLLTNSFDMSVSEQHKTDLDENAYDCKGLRYYTLSKATGSNRVAPTYEHDAPHSLRGTPKGLIPLYSPAAKSDSYKNNYRAEATRFRPFTPKEKEDWLRDHKNRGFIRVYDPNSNLQSSVVVPLSTTTTCQQVCVRFGSLSPDSMHVQFNGDVIQRLEPFDHPLKIQLDYMKSLGIDEVARQQEIGDSMQLGFWLRFFAGRPFFDDGFSQQTLSACCHVRRGKVFQHWTRRMCVLNGTRLLIYEDATRQGNPEILTLARAKVEEINLRTRGRCIKITVNMPRKPDQSVYLAFDSLVDLNAWLSRSSKAAATIPPLSDLSNLQLECLPEHVFCTGSDRLITNLNLKHNRLRERPPSEDYHIIGWLNDIVKLQSLRSLNLSDNDLRIFPSCLLQLPALTELNLSTNKLKLIPAEINELKFLQNLNIQNNLINRLPLEMAQCESLQFVDLSFNLIVEVPEVLISLKIVESWNLAGNRIRKIPSDDFLKNTSHVKKIDLRLNDLVWTKEMVPPLGILQGLSSLDLRGNINLIEIDLCSLVSLKSLNIQRTKLSTLQMNGTFLQSVTLSRNELNSIIVMPVPQNLKLLDVSHNRFNKLPEWITELGKLEKLYASHNKLALVPQRLFTNASSLKHIDLNHNEIRNLPNQIENCFLEHIDLHHNKLRHLPNHFLALSHKLRYLNLAQNCLSSLPVLNTFTDLNKVQCLILSANRFQDDVIHTISGYHRLRILDVAYNHIRNIDNGCIEKLQFLEEVNVSGNRLHCLPITLAELPKLAVFRAHSNQLVSLPDFSNCQSLKVLDLGSNRLEGIEVYNSISPSLKQLDLSCNPKLKLDTGKFDKYKQDRQIALIDMSVEAKETERTSTTTPWQAGFSESSGERNKLCIAQVRQKLNVGGELFAMIDGGLNNQIPSTLCTKLPDILEAEIQNQSAKTEPTDELEYLKYAMLSSHRSLDENGQKLGAACTICRISKHKSNNNKTHSEQNASSDDSDDERYDLDVATVGHCEVVLCRRGEPVILTENSVVAEHHDEYVRVRKSGGIVTEENEINGTTSCSRLLGSNFLWPSVIPTPYLAKVSLGEPDEFMVIASRGLWERMSATEVVRRIRYIPNPISAAKHLQDMARSYGYMENLSVLVIRFFFNPSSTELSNGERGFHTRSPLPLITASGMNFGYAASAINLGPMIESTDTLTTIDEVKSEPRGRKYIREKPNYYFEYKKKLKELQLDSVTTIHSMGSSSMSIETIIDNRCDPVFEDDDRFEDQDSLGSLSDGTITPDEPEHVLAQLNFPPSSSSKSSSLQQDRELSSCMVENDNIEFNANESKFASDGSSSSSGFGKSDHSGSPRHGSLEHLEGSIKDDVQMRPKTECELEQVPRKNVISFEFPPPPIDLLPADDSIDSNRRDNGYGSAEKDSEELTDQSVELSKLANGYSQNLYYNSNFTTGCGLFSRDAIDRAGDTLDSLPTQVQKYLYNEVEPQQMIHDDEEYFLPKTLFNCSKTGIKLDIESNNSNVGVERSESSDVYRKARYQKKSRPHSFVGAMVKAIEHQKVGGREKTSRRTPVETKSKSGSFVSLIREQLKDKLKFPSFSNNKTTTEKDSANTLPRLLTDRTKSFDAIASQINATLPRAKGGSDDIEEPKKPGERFYTIRGYKNRRAREKERRHSCPNTEEIDTANESNLEPNSSTDAVAYDILRGSNVSQGHIYDSPLQLPVYDTLSHSKKQSFSMHNTVNGLPLPPQISPRSDDLDWSQYGKPVLIHELANCDTQL